MHYPHPQHGTHLPPYGLYHASATPFGSGVGTSYPLPIPPIGGAHFASTYPQPQPQPQPQQKDHKHPHLHKFFHPSHNTRHERISVPSQSAGFPHGHNLNPSMVSDQPISSTGGYGRPTYLTQNDRGTVGTRGSVVQRGRQYLPAETASRYQTTYGAAFGAPGQQTDHGFRLADASRSPKTPTGSTVPPRTPVSGTSQSALSPLSTASGRLTAPPAGIAPPPGRRGSNASQSDEIIEIYDPDDNTSPTIPPSTAQQHPGRAAAAAASGPSSVLVPQHPIDAARAQGGGLGSAHGSVYGHDGYYMSEEQQLAYLRREDEARLEYTRGFPQAVEGEVGLENPIGAHNCFVNVVLQALWHIPRFRDAFRNPNYTAHACTNSGGSGNCTFCAIKGLFVQYGFSGAAHLPPQEVRHTVSKAFSSKSRFQLDQMDDAAELFDALLQELHNSVTPNQDEVCEPECLMHKIFSATILEQPDECRKCHEDKAPLSYRSFLQYFPAKLLMEATDHMWRTTTFAQILHDHFQGEYQTCDKCHSEVRTEKYLLSAPEVMAFVLAWEDESCTTSDIAAAVRKIPPTIHLEKMFKVPANECRNQKHLIGLVCFYGKHYICYFKQCKLTQHGQRTWGQWVYFDDSTVKLVGEWHDVEQRVIGGRQQPLIIFYADP